MKRSPIVKISTEFFSKATFKAEHLSYLHDNNKEKHKGRLKRAKKPSSYVFKYFYFCLSNCHLNKGAIILPRQTS